MAFEIANVLIIVEGQIPQNTSIAAVYDCVGVMHPLYQISSKLLAEDFLLAPRRKRNESNRVRKTRRKRFASGKGQARFPRVNTANLEI